ncbi:hypothetical protein ACFL2J_06655 [Candidatus Omnitrophota bacterium]
MDKILLILQVLKNAFSVLGFFFSPEIRKKRDRKADWKSFKDLERQYREALANKDPQKASQIAKQMKELRAEYKFLNNKGGKDVA